jgi:hypothetical protein
MEQSWGLCLLIHFEFLSQKLGAAHAKLIRAMATEQMKSPIAKQSAAFCH